MIHLQLFLIKKTNILKAAKGISYLLRLKERINKFPFFMKKTSLLLGTLILQLTAAYAQQTEQPSRNVRRTKALLESRLNDVMKVNALRARDGEETPLAQGRRIIQQEYFSGNTPQAEWYINYGYTSATVGQEFHPSMILGFPMDISVAGKADHVFFPQELFPNWAPFPPLVFPMHSVAPEIVIDSLDLYADTDLAYSVTAKRGANNRIDTLVKTENYVSGQDITKSEKFYTNNLLTKVDEYYGENLSALELESRRLIAYGNNQQITSDTLFFYYQGAIDETLIFGYTYNSNGDVSQITVSSDYGDSAVVMVDYYTDNRYKSHTFSMFYDTDLEGIMTDSIGYAANGFIATRKMGNADIDTSGTPVFEYNILNMTYNGNLLDSLKVSQMNDTGAVAEDGFAKYYYSIDNNPDSLVMYVAPGVPAEAKMVFHYAPYNTTSVKNITRNNNFNIYPNPIGATMNVYNKVALKDHKATIMITDIKGARVWSVEQALTQGANQIHIPAGLSAGTYVISITADNSVYTQKVIKQ